MKIAVLMSTYNGEQYLADQINSILNQHIDAEVKLIVRDDGSNDRTKLILDSYSTVGELNYSVGENIGAARAFIELVRDNPGFDYYSFADQDDVWYADKLSRAVSSIETCKGPALYCTNCKLVDSSLNAIGRDTHRENPTYNLISILTLSSCAQGCTSMFNEELARIIRENNVPDCLVMHDSLMTCLCALIDGTIIYDEEPSMLYRMHGKNVFGMITAKQNILAVIRDRLLEMTQKKSITMYDQAKSLLATYGTLFSEENKKVCSLVIASEKSVGARLELILNPQLRHDTINKTLTKKLEILFGND